jgi:hypothetical protein
MFSHVFVALACKVIKYYDNYYSIFIVWYYKFPHSFSSGAIWTAHPSTIPAMSWLDSGERYKSRKRCEVSYEIK